MEVPSLALDLNGNIFFVTIVAKFTALVHYVTARINCEMAIDKHLRLYVCNNDYD